MINLALGLVSLTKKTVEKAVSKVYENFKSKLLIGALLFDLSKACDTVSHTILIQKLK